jgi:hypothetical protein
MSYFVRFEVLTAMKIEVEVFWILTLCRIVVGKHRFGGQLVVFYHTSTQRHKPEDLEL